MSQNEKDLTRDGDQAAPEAGISKDPSRNTSPPSNPPVDQEAVDKGEENLGSVVSW